MIQNNTSMILKETPNGHNKQPRIVTGNSQSLVVGGGGVNNARGSNLK
jgi:hypothetical protein